MNLSLVTFTQEFDRLIGDEWSCLFELNQQALGLKNRNIGTKKFQTIIEAIFALSHHTGFQAMTMRDLSEASKISMGGLYKYFSTKDQIAKMIHDALTYMAQTCLGAANKQSKDPIFALNELLARHVFLSERLKKWFYFVFMECRTLDESLIQSFMHSEQVMEQAILQKIEAANDQKMCQCTNPAFVSAMLKVMLQDWYLKPWKYQQKQINADQYVANLLLATHQMLAVK